MRVFIGSQCVSSHIINCKRKKKAPLEWRKLANHNLTQVTNITTLSTRQPDITCLLTGSSFPIRVTSRRFMENDYYESHRDSKIYCNKVNLLLISFSMTFWSLYTCHKHIISLNPSMRKQLSKSKMRGILCNLIRLFLFESIAQKTVKRLANCHRIPECKRYDNEMYYVIFDWTLEFFLRL